MRNCLLTFAAAAAIMAGSGAASAQTAAPASAPASGPAPSAQQSKMGQCNDKAGPMKGDERKKFMSECLKANPS